MELHEHGLASGLFLSSGLGQNALRTRDDMLKTAEIIRRGRGFQGYLHLKILLGATEQYVEAACRLADRVSANLEVPSAERLSTLCPDKDFQHDLVDPPRLVAKIRRREGDRVLPLVHTQGRRSVMVWSLTTCVSQWSGQDWRPYATTA